LFCVTPVFGDGLDPGATLEKPDFPLRLGALQVKTGSVWGEMA
jgi:hypothetical protein